MAGVVGGVEAVHGSSENALEFDDLGRFAVEEHNKKANSLLEFERVVDVKKQVVAGTLYHLVLEVNEGGEKKYYEAKVWEKAWMNFRQLQEFKPVEGPTST